MHYFSHGDPNIGYETESTWIPASYPSYEYLQFNGNATQLPQMTYDEELKIRSEFWVHIFDQIHQKRSNCDLSQKVPMNSTEALNFRKQFQ